MSYASRLKAMVSEKGPREELTKQTKPPFVSFGSASEQPIAEVVRLLERAGCGPNHPDHAEALTLALRFPGGMETLRLTRPAKGAV